MKRLLPALLCACAGLWLAAVFAAQDDARLEPLFSRLERAENAAEAQAVELAIWRIWTASGRDDVDALMEQGIDAMTKRKLDAAVSAFDRVVELMPDFAEGWNKRATVYYLRGELVESVRDVQRTLELEPRHFGALSGMGLIFMQRGDDAAAIDAFEAVLRIHPKQSSARIHIEMLRSKLRDKAV